MTKSHIFCAGALAAAFLLGNPLGATGKSAYTLNWFQEKTIKGKLTDTDGKAIAEADITNKKSGQVVQSAADGSFSILAAPGDELEVAQEGFFPFSIIISAENAALPLQIILKEQTLAAARKVQLPSGTRSVDQVTGSFDVIYNRELIKSPVVDITNALSGRLSGLYTLQQGATPGSEKAAMWMRGLSNPLIVIDGIPREYTVLNPAEIESVTVLKDAVATNLYGMRASNGAILITTRKGTPGKQVVSFTAQYGVQQPTRKPSYLGAYDYARLFNEALQNDGLPAQYPDAALEAYRTGSDPYLFPDVGWYNTITRNKMNFARYSADVSGGGKFATYYLALDHVNQEGIFVTDKEKNTYNTNNDYRQYSIRSNVSMNINPTLTAYLNVFALVRNGTQPGATTSSVLSGILSTPNNAYPIVNPDGSIAGTTERNTNLYAQTVNSGYRQSYNRNIYADVGLKKELNALLKGLYLLGTASFGTDLTEDVNRSKVYASYKMNVDPVSGDTTYTKFGNDATQNNSGSIPTQTRNNFWQLGIGFNRNFATKHEVTAKALVSNQQYSADATLPLKYITYALNGTYRFDNRFDLEMALSAMEQNRYPSGNDLGFFPAGGLGWTISNEKWFPELKALNALRLKTSYGLTGIDNVGYYIYDQFYASGTGYTLGNTPTGIGGVVESALANPFVTWEKAKKFNIGAEAKLLKDKLAISAEYYIDRYFDLMQTRGRSNAIIGNSFPLENIGENRYHGWDISIQFQESRGKLQYYAGLKFSTRQSEIIFQDEVERKYAWMKRTGQKVDQTFGYIADGFYSEADVANKIPTLEGYAPVPGDIKYRDLNSDGVINRYDMASIRNTKPLLYGGFQAGVSYAGIEFSFLLQGAANRDVLLFGTSEWEFQPFSGGGYQQAQAHHLNRWTPATAATATYPRLTVGTNVNNHTTSSFWVRSGNYLRLKNVELAYALPRKWVNAIRLSNAKFFLNGFNLLTFSKENRFDPEYTSVAGYPNLKAFNAGVNIKF